MSPLKLASLFLGFYLMISPLDKLVSQNFVAASSQFQPKVHLHDRAISDDNDIWPSNTPVEGLGIFNSSYVLPEETNTLSLEGSDNTTNDSISNFKIPLEVPLWTNATINDTVNATVSIVTPLWANTTVNDTAYTAFSLDTPLWPNTTAEVDYDNSYLNVTDDRSDTQVTRNMTSILTPLWPNTTTIDSNSYVQPSNASLSTTSGPAKGENSTSLNQPDSLYMIIFNGNNAENKPMMTQEQYRQLQQDIKALDSKLILPKGQTGDCIPLRDDPCVNATAMMEDLDIQNSFADVDEQQDKDNNDHGNGVSHGYQHNHDHLATILGTSLGVGIPASAALGFKVWHSSGLSKFGNMINQRWTGSAIGRLGSFLGNSAKNLLGMHGMPIHGISPGGGSPGLFPHVPEVPVDPSGPIVPHPPVPQPEPYPMEPVPPPPMFPPFPPLGPVPGAPAPPVPPGVLPPAPVPPGAIPPAPVPPVPPAGAPIPPGPPPGPSPPGGPPNLDGGPNNPEDDQDHQDEQEDPDDGKSSPPMTPRRDPLLEMMNRLTRRAKPECPPKLRKAEAEIKKLKKKLDKSEKTLRKRERQINQYYKQWEDTRQVIGLDDKKAKDDNDELISSMMDERISLERALEELNAQMANMDEILQESKDAADSKDDAIQLLLKDRKRLEIKLRHVAHEGNLLSYQKSKILNMIEDAKMKFQSPSNELQGDYKRKSEQLKTTKKELKETMRKLGQLDSKYEILTRKLKRVKGKWDQQREQLVKCHTRTAKCEKELKDLEELNNYQRFHNQEVTSGCDLDEETKHLKAQLAMLLHLRDQSDHQTEILQHSLGDCNKYRGKYQPPGGINVKNSQVAFLEERNKMLLSSNQYMSKALESVTEERSSLARQLDKMTKTQCAELTPALRRRIADLEKSIRTRAEEQLKCANELDKYKAKQCIVDTERASDSLKLQSLTWQKNRAHEELEDCKDDLKEIKQPLAPESPGGSTSQFLSTVKLLLATRSALYECRLLKHAAVSECVSWIDHKDSIIKHRDWELRECNNQLKGNHFPAGNKPAILPIPKDIKKFDYEGNVYELGNELDQKEPSLSLVNQLGACTWKLDSQYHDARQCWSQCSCPSGIRPGSDHLKRGTAFKIA